MGGARGCGTLPFRIDRAGTWHYQGSPIDRPALVTLFASVLRRAPDGTYWLVTPAEQGRIEVEDVPFVAVELAREGDGRMQTLRLRTNLDEWIALDAAHGLELRPDERRGQHVPYVEVRDGLEARLSTQLYYELAELAVRGPDGAMGVWSQGRFFPLEPPRAAA
jgi:hypothetical protein